MHTVSKLNGKSHQPKQIGLLSVKLTEKISPTKSNQCSFGLVQSELGWSFKNSVSLMFFCPPKSEILRDVLTKAVNP